MAAKPSMATMAISDRAFMQYLRTFGRSPKIVDLVQVYKDLKDSFDSEAPLEDALMRFRRALLQMEMEVEGEPSIIAIDDLGGQIRPLLRRLHAGSPFC